MQEEIENNTELRSHLQEGDHVPEVVFKVREGDGPVCGDNTGHWVDLTSSEVFGGKKVIVFSLPGAYTPTCSSSHLPGYEAKYNEIKGMGVDEIYCISVNDAYVMQQWAMELGSSKVRMLPDGNGDFTRGMGMMVSKRNLGFGERSWRYSMLVEDGVVTKLFPEPGFCDDCGTDPFEVSDVDTMLGYLKGKK